jgi:hypothetical protein
MLLSGRIEKTSSFLKSLRIDETKWKVKMGAGG